MPRCSSLPDVTVVLSAVVRGAGGNGLTAGSASALVLAVRAALAVPPDSLSSSRSVPIME